jgi:hypothetical protein
VNVSGGGALLETTARLLPGSLVDLHLTSSREKVVMRARVLRCAVVRLQAGDVWYRGAVSFDGVLGLMDDGALKAAPR